MSIDPYHAVQQEVETLLHNADQLFASYRRIRNIASSDSEELTYARNEVYITYFSKTYSPCLHCVLFLLFLVASNHTCEFTTCPGGFRRECEVFITVVITRYPLIHFFVTIGLSSQGTLACLGSTTQKF